MDLQRNLNLLGTHPESPLLICCVHAKGQDRQLKIYT